MILDEFRLDGQVALVMGAGSPEGSAIAAGLSEAGAQVIAVAHTGLPDTGGADDMALRLEADLTAEADVARVVREATEAFGPPDILVNAAQLVYARPFLGTPPTDWRTLFDLNVGAAMLACQAAGPAMIERGTGKIVNLASGMGVRGLPSSAAFAATQGAIIQLTAALAIEWAPRGIKVNAAAPVWLESGEPADSEEGLMKYIPMRRRGTLDELANLVVFLACDGAHFLTGKTVFLDGAVLSHA